VGISDILQPTHLLFILVVALVFLGPKRLPEVGRSLGKSMRDFRGALSGLEEQSSELHSMATVHLNPDPPAAPPAPVTPATVSPAPSPAVDHSVASAVVATPTPAPEAPAFDVSGVEAAAAEPHLGDTPS
jgi:sec-independent protein translocase protein TatA